MDKIKKTVIAKANECFDSIDKAVDENLVQKYPALKQIKQSVPVRPAYIVVGLVSALVLLVLFGVGANALCNLIGFLYPLYASFKALKTPATKDDSQWLTYWIVYNTFNVVESFTDFLASFIPFYVFLKIAFLLWCQLPQTQGATVIYRRVLEPFLLKHESSIDSALARGRDAAKTTKEAAEALAKQGEELAKNK